MTIYTKYGDQGNTQLRFQMKVDKTDLRIEALSSIDEINAWLGVLVAHISNSQLSKTKQLLQKIQNYFFELGAQISALGSSEYSDCLLSNENLLSLATEMEQSIDHISTKLPPLDQFILPGGSKLSSWVHLARAVCRRVEVVLVRLMSVYPELTSNPITIINRLSDYLFILARYMSHLDQVKDVYWQKTVE